MNASSIGSSSLSWLVRFGLLAGLVVHKAIWELLRRHSVARAANQQPLRIRVVKSAKVGILFAVIVQTLLPWDILPISSGSGPLRAAGAVVYVLGLLVAVLARLQLGRNWSDIESPVVGPNHAVVARGIYGYIRHPIYVGDLALLVGLELCLNSWLVLGLVLLIPVVLRKAILEEKMLARSLPGYDDYLTKTKRFIPFVV